MMLSAYKNILWDFDGVILDSMPTRERGFAGIFKAFPQAQVDELLQYHRDNGGLSRFAKIRYFYEQILHQPITEAQVDTYAAQFSEKMRRILADKKLLIVETVDYIEANYEKYNFHVVSASEQSELRYLIAQLDLSAYFKSVYGSPAVKAANIKKVIAENGYQLQDTCLIGDSGNDYEASAESNIDFWGYNNIKLLHTGRGYLHNFQF